MMHGPMNIRFGLTVLIKPWWAQTNKNLWIFKL